MPTGDAYKGRVGEGRKVGQSATCVGFNLIFRVHVLGLTS